MRASLPMYDLPELRAATDGWWRAIRQALVARGLPVPADLDRGAPPVTVWQAPDLLLSQCCGRDLVTHLAGAVVPVAIPCYRVPGCPPGQYRSWLVVRRDDPRERLADLAGATAAVNYTGSHSGWIALAHALACAGLPEHCLTLGRLTGSHRASLAAVCAGDADLAAIDAVTFALLARVDPALVAGVRVLAASETAPALPYITAAARPMAVRAALAAALAEAATDAGSAAMREQLLIDGFLDSARQSYDRTRSMAAEALRQPCARLERAATAVPVATAGPLGPDRAGSLDDIAVATGSYPLQLG